MVSVYYTLADFYEAPFIKKCKFCNALYRYTPEDDWYIQPFAKQIENKECVECNARLSEALMSVYTNIKCCNCDTMFSLDDNFTHGMRYDSFTEEIEVYLLYDE
jgi:phage FluMu protein Com